MTLDIYQIDAFACRLFEGNPAAVCPLDEWLPDKTLQKIAMENNISETAFFVEDSNGFQLRWFTPQTEVNLCGHATLAAAHLIFSHLGYNQSTIAFHTQSGEIKVQKSDGWYRLNLPAKSFPREAPPLNLHNALGGIIADEVYKSDDFLWVLDKPEKVQYINPNFTLLSKVNPRGVIITAPASDKDIDFVSRFFAPSIGVNEDPVTGSAHCMLVPYWAQRLGKKQLTARQLSERGGQLKCQLLDDDRVMISGQACTYLHGQIIINT